MDFSTQKERALVILAGKGIPRHTSEPALVRILWALGAKVPPPHFMKFSTLALMCGVWFATAWGAFMWVFVWSGRGASVYHVAGVAAGVGVFFGIFMAAYYSRGKTKYDLPTWDSLGTP
jgi:hypothetical protein